VIPALRSPALALRVSDAERERVATCLRESCGEGRLDLGEFEQRLDRVYAAKTGWELRPLVADLPAGAGALPGARLPRVRRRRPLVRLGLLAGFALVVAGLLEAALAAPLELGIVLALLAVLALLVLEALAAVLPALLLLAVVWFAVRALRTLQSTVPPR